MEAADLDITRFVENSQLLAFLDEEGRARLLKCAQVRDVAAGEPVVREGDPGDAF
jgi:hypothetical protein